MLGSSGAILYSPFFEQIQNTVSVILKKHSADLQKDVLDVFINIQTQSRFNSPIPIQIRGSCTTGVED